MVDGRWSMFLGNNYFFRIDLVMVSMGAEGRRRQWTPGSLFLVGGAVDSQGIGEELTCRDQQVPQSHN